MQCTLMSSINPKRSPSSLWWYPALSFRWMIDSYECLCMRVSAAYMCVSDMCACCACIHAAPAREHGLQQMMMLCTSSCECNTALSAFTTQGQPVIRHSRGLGCRCASGAVEGAGGCLGCSPGRGGRRSLGGHSSHTSKVVQVLRQAPLLLPALLAVQGCTSTMCSFSHDTPGTWLGQTH